MILEFLLSSYYELTKDRLKAEFTGKIDSIGKDAKNFNSQKLSVNLDNIAPIFAESYDDANVEQFHGTSK